MKDHNTPFRKIVACTKENVPYRHSVCFRQATVEWNRNDHFLNGLKFSFLVSNICLWEAGIQPEKEQMLKNLQKSLL